MGADTGVTVSSSVVVVVVVAKGAEVGVDIETDSSVREEPATTIGSETTSLDLCLGSCSCSCSSVSAATASSVDDRALVLGELKILS